MAAARGLYAKGKVKRAEILDVALEVIATNGYTGASVKELADAVGLSQNGLLHYFGSKDALYLEILRRRDEIAAIQIDHQDSAFMANLVDNLLSAIDLEISSPGMAQLSLRVTGEATEPEHIAHAFVQERYKGVRSVVQDSIDILQEKGMLSPDIDSRAAAALIFASWDGLLTQWMYDNTIDVRAHMTYLVRALGLEITTPAVAAPE
jgi:AcrR family transcriptional regulator